MFFNLKNQNIITIRGGLFYDPAPSEGGVDEIYGISFGLGFAKRDKFCFDFSYQYRYGNDIGETLFELPFSEDIEEHTIYFSMINYL